MKDKWRFQENRIRNSGNTKRSELEMQTAIGTQLLPRNQGALLWDEGQQTTLRGQSHTGSFLLLSGYAGRAEQKDSSDLQRTLGSESGRTDGQWNRRIHAHTTSRKPGAAKTSERWERTV